MPNQPDSSKPAPRASDISKLWMRDALLALMQETPYSKITVTQIAKKAGVSRLTFYRNFDSKDDILRFHLQSGFEEYLEKIHTGHITDLEQAIALCFEFWSQRKDEIRLFIRQKVGPIMLQPFESCFDKLLQEFDLETAFTPLQQRFIAGGMFSAMLTWIEEDGSQSASEAARQIMETISTV